MKLSEFSVTNYRSITTAHKIVLQDLTVLVGKNNEGKSNLLTALKTAMMAMIYHSKSGENIPPYSKRRLYDWNRDFPIQYQTRRNGLESIFKLHFRLEGEEINEFHDFTGIRGNEDIPITVKFGRDNMPKIEVPKRGSSSYNRKSKQVTEFISRRLYFNYIQAIRTEDMAIDALQSAIAGQLNQLSTNAEYQEAKSKVSEIEEGVLNALADQLKEPLKAFLPNLQSISINRTQYPMIHRPWNDIDVLIDDGQKTSIANKGDGIKSLVTLAILKEQYKKEGASIIAIEEPESHLHSGAIHSLVDVISKMSENNQVIITTHNPLFVQQNKLNANIIVDNGTAKAAKKISEIRNILGVMPSDNLKNSRFVLLVEGEDDKITLQSILSLKSVILKDALVSNQLVIKPMGGAGNLLHDANDLKNSMCKFVVLLDNDKAGNEAYEKAIKAKALSEKMVKFTICKGSPESELEDCLKSDIYAESILEHYNVNIKTKEFKGKGKWSNRMKNTFLAQGSKWTESIEKEVKLLVADCIANRNTKKVESVLIKEKAGFIDGLVTALERMLAEE